MNIWKAAKKININITFECSYKFIFQINDNINRDVKKNLINFMNYIEDEYSLKTPIYINFINKDYLIDQQGKKVGYIFYWKDFKNYPNIYNDDEFPHIDLPVNNNKWTVDEIIASFIEVMTMYYAWCLNIIADDYEVNYSFVNEVLKEYRTKFLY